MNEFFHLNGEYIAESGLDCSFQSAPQISLEIQEHIDRAFPRIHLQPVSDRFVVYGQFAEDLFLMGLQFCQDFLVFRFVEDIPRRDRPGGA